jgi:ribosomal protein L19
MLARKLDLRAGDTVKVWQKIKEGEKTRLQAFEGLVLARKHGAEAGATFTVRKSCKRSRRRKNFSRSILQ